MFAYYLDLALRSLKRNKVLTALMVLALALGIGASMTTLTLLRLLSGNPLPEKSSQLFYVQLDPYPKDHPFSRSDKLPWLLTYVDAMNLLHAHRAPRQAAVAMSRMKLTPTTTQKRPFFSDGVMTTADFFGMFEAPFQYGGGWSAADDETRAKVVVIAEALNNRLFGGANSVGRMLRINDQDFRIIGVLRHWSPQPHFYSLYLGGRNYGDGDAVFVPLTSARAAALDPINEFSYGDGNREVLETAPVIWLGFWAQLPDKSAASAYASFLTAYAQQQVELGRFQRPRSSLSTLMHWLDSQHVVPDNVRMQTGLAFSFLLICIVNTVGLLLAKCLRRSKEIGVRRALGASRPAIFAQFMVEAGLIGIAGGAFGLLFAEFGLWCIRRQPAEYASLAHLNLSMFACTFAVALIASLIAGILPAWRACVITPAPQLKSA
ncbi:ABC transporter permease [Dyella acidiphila]|uniref:ABC transporter permease n=1 Tax=Dyella acidiphila TaxID=2775866 RepID=A0ABR9G494_9GAMM|nr:ABC transporter permease [Dyella acidiphila]MBE1158845.1 ABC transporter permease [Dyella acidiphila]